MEVRISQNNGAQIVVIDGDLDGATTPLAQEHILPLAAPGVRIILDMSKVEYMSSAGLRMLLLMYRTIVGKGGKVVLVGLSEDLADTMAMTGFLDFFSRFDSVEAGLASLNLSA
ncbi:MAG: STAS domain-containing protein [Chloroflexota bacterium]